jgi:hypothetical protein
VREAESGLRGRRIAAAFAAGVAAVTLAACDGSSTSRLIPPPPSAQTLTPAELRPISPCPADVRIPDVRSSVQPASTLAPTAELTTGDAVVLADSAGRTVGFTGSAPADESSVVCRSAASDGGVVLLGRSPGYVRVAVLNTTTSGPTDLAYVRVTG